MGADEPIIALTPAGVIPFESRLRTVDMLGLNDPWTARNGADVPAKVVPKAGHERIATVQHLLDSGVNLVIGHPRVEAPAGAAYDMDDVDAMFLRHVPDPENIPDSATMVEMPLPDGRVLRMLYLTPDPTVDALIEDGTWRQVPIDLGR
jgi:arabinofuranosyltransferase